MAMYAYIDCTPRRIHGFENMDLQREFLEHAAASK